MGILGIPKIGGNRPKKCEGTEKKNKIKNEFLIFFFKWDNRGKERMLKILGNFGNCCKKNPLNFNSRNLKIANSQIPKLPQFFKFQIPKICKIQICNSQNFQFPKFRVLSRRPKPKSRRQKIPEISLIPQKNPNPQILNS